MARKTRRTRPHEIDYQTLGDICDLISAAKNLTRVAQLTVARLQEKMGLKGCALMLLDRRTRKLEIAASEGLSDFYLSKGPLSAGKSIADSLKEGPVAIFDVRDDPRLQYPEEAKREGIASILSVPLVLRGRPLGVLRLYTAEPWEFTLADVNFAQAVALILALALDGLRVAGAYKTSVEVLKKLRPAAKPRRRTLHE
ncbi:MAG: GAF domain-containing protein [Desulfarculus sp.]|jgi:signal transduction protein with GAF and PtsI domain|nr:MAG: GAF domain-containing protein [Desulfarculus sp.]